MRKVPKVHIKYYARPLMLGVLLMLFTACSTSAADPKPAVAILASLDRTHEDAFPLDGHALAGPVHVFVAEPAGGLDRVAFSIINGSGVTVSRYVDVASPFTPTPDGGPLDPEALGPGRHTLVAVSTLAAGGSLRAEATFDVVPPGTGEPGDELGGGPITGPGSPLPGPRPDVPAPLPPTTPGPSDPPPPTGRPGPLPSPDVPAPQPPTGPVWQPKPGTSWQWQLSGRLDTSVEADVYDIDLEGTSPATIAHLHALGRRVICYFSAGSYEPGRSDSARFPRSVKGKKMDGWDELWLDIRNIDALAPIMLARLDMAAAKGCDAVEPDNVDGYQNDTGFPLRAADQVRYNRWLAEQAHARGLAIGLKNDLDQVNDLVAYFDFAVNEECFAYGECELLLPFIRAGKAVFGAEYELATGSFCSKANSLDMDFIRKNLNLDAFRQSCR